METTTIEKQTQDVLVVANNLVIQDNEQEAYAVEYCKVIKNMQKQVSETFDPIVEKAHSAHKEATTQRAKFLDPLKEAEKRIKTLIGNYRVALETKRLEEERKAKELLDAQVEKERQALMAQAEKAEKEGNTELADQLAVKAVSIEAGGIAVRSESVKQSGTSVVMVWKARVVNSALVPREFLVVDEQALNAYAKANGKNKPVAGVEFYEEPSIRIRS